MIPKLPIIIQVVITCRALVKTAHIHHKVAHALGLRDGGDYPYNTWKEAVDLDHRYQERLISSY